MGLSRSALSRRDGPRYNNSGPSYKSVRPLHSFVAAPALLVAEAWTHHTSRPCSCIAALQLHDWPVPPPQRARKLPGAQPTRFLRSVRP